MSLAEIAAAQQAKWAAERVRRMQQFMNGTNVCSYAITPRSIEVPIEALTDEELKRMVSWTPRKPVSRACLIAANRNRYKVVRVIEDLTHSVELSKEFAT